MKKLAIFCLIFTLVCSFAACDKQEPPQDSNRSADENAFTATVTE